jgi:hypothetical protein
MIIRVILAALTALSLLPHARAVSARALTLESAPVRFSVNDPDEDTVGKLQFRGALRLTSDDKDFGGLSGLIVSDDGSRFLAITDASHWVTGSLAYSGGKLSAAAGSTIAPMLNLGGEAMEGKQGDAEGLAPVNGNDPDGPVFVSFERNHRIWAYGPARGGQRQALTGLPLPQLAFHAPPNKGLEALTVHGAKLIAIAENYPDARGHHQGWILSAKPKYDAPQAIFIKARPQFSVTDARMTPSGDLLTLERRYGASTGIAFQIRRHRGADVRANAVLDGEVLAHLGMSYVIDNMEGMSVRVNAKGETLIYLIADDNFNAPLQQTLLMMFAVKE